MLPVVILRIESSIMRNSNNESKGKFDVYCKTKDFIERKNI